MNIRGFVALAIALAASTTAFAQSPKAATYITDEEVKKVNTLPGVDRQLSVSYSGASSGKIGFYPTSDFLFRQIIQLLDLPAFESKCLWVSRQP